MNIVNSSNNNNNQKIRQPFNDFNLNLIINGLMKTNIKSQSLALLFFYRLND